MTMLRVQEHSPSVADGSLRWALAPVHEIQRLVETGRDDEAVERLQHRPYEELKTCPELAVLFATALVRRGLIQEAYQLAAVAVSAARARVDDRAEALAVALCGEIALARGELESASSCFAQAHSLAVQQQHPALAGECLAQLGQVALLREDPAEAVSDYLAAVACYERVGDVREAARCQSELAKAYCALASYDDALSAADRAVDAAQQLGEPSVHAEMLKIRAEVRLAAGDPGVALSEAVRAAAMQRSLNESAKEADALAVAKRAQAAMERPSRNASRQIPETNERFERARHEEAPQGLEQPSGHDSRERLHV